jgi:hypothetical protein
MLKLYYIPFQGLLLLSMLTYFPGATYAEARVDSSQVGPDQKKDSQKDGKHDDEKKKKKIVAGAVVGGFVGGTGFYYGLRSLRQKMRLKPYYDLKEKRESSATTSSQFPPLPKENQTTRRGYWIKYYKRGTTQSKAVIIPHMDKESREKRENEKFNKWEKGEWDRLRKQKQSSTYILGKPSDTDRRYWYRNKLEEQLKQAPDEKTKAEIEKKLEWVEEEEKRNQKAKELQEEGVSRGRARTLAQKWQRDQRKAQAKAALKMQEEEGKFDPRLHSESHAKSMKMQEAVEARMEKFQAKFME